MINRLKLLFFLAGICSASFAQDGHAVVDLDMVAEKMMFPKDQLQLNDITLMMRNRLGAGILASQEVRGRDENIFHPMSFIAAEPRTLLTDELVKKSDAYLEGMKGKPEKSKGLRRLDLPDGSWGYVGVEGFGPGGALIAATLTDAARTRDVKIIIACGNQQLVSVTGGEAYGKLFSGETDATNGITTLAASLVKAAKAIEIRSQSSTNQQPIVKPSELPKVRNAAPTSHRLPVNAQQAHSFNYIPWLIGVLGVAIILTVALRRV